HEVSSLAAKPRIVPSLQALQALVVHICEAEHMGEQRAVGIEMASLGYQADSWKSERPHALGRFRSQAALKPDKVPPVPKLGLHLFPIGEKHARQTGSRAPHIGDNARFSEDRGHVQI